jgi:hypothetical protein
VSALRRGLLALTLLAPLVLAGCASNASVDIADIHGLAVDPSDSARLLVATHHGLFRAQHDKAWAAVTKDPFDMMGFTMHPSDASIMYASGHPRLGGLIGFAKSTDSGINWNVIALKGQVDFHAMTLSLAKPERLWGYFNQVVQRSDDGGLQWSVVSKGTPPQILAFASSPANADQLYAAGSGGIYRSKDGGATFETLYSGSGQASTIAATKSDADVLVAYFAQGGLMRSQDAGVTWKPLNLTFPSDDGGAAVAIDPKNPDVVYVGSYRALIRKTVDGGATWSNVR